MDRQKNPDPTRSGAPGTPETGLSGVSGVHESPAMNPEEVVTRIRGGSPGQQTPALSAEELVSVASTIDSLTADVSSSRAELESQNRFNALRAEIWRAAFDAPRPELDLLQNLLEKVGAVFGVARASFFLFDQGNGDAVCKVQWCSPGLEDTRGLTIPERVHRLFRGRDHVVLSGEQARTIDPEIAAILERTRIGSFLAIFYPDAKQPAGFVSLSHREQDHAWTERDIGIIAEVVKIVSLRAAQYNAEDALKKVNERLERQIKKRTSELHEIVDKLRQDIAERKAVEERLRERERFLHNVFESIQDGISILDSDHTIVRVNPTMERWYAHAVPLLGKKCYEAYHDQQAPCNVCPSREALANGQSVCLTVPRRDAQRAVTGWLDLYAFPLMDTSTGRMTGIIEYFRDITDRQKAEQRLAEEKELLDVTLRSIGDGVISTNTSGTIVLMNAVAEKFTGVRQSEAVGKHLEEILNLVAERTRKKCESPIRRAIESGSIAGSAGDRLLIARDGSERIVADSAAPIRNRAGDIMGGVLVFRDITDHQKLENELFKARKLESVGVLAGGIAHDFNNILTGIVTNLFMAKMSSGEELKQLITDAEKAAMRASRLTKQLLTFSRGGSPVKENASIRELIGDSVGFCLSGSNVDYRLDLPDDLWGVEVDRGQVDQVLNNLVVNADQAMPDGGTITIRGENVVIDDTIQTGTAYGLPLKPGKYVKISVRDEGIGIPPKDLERIFDPYFTTKQTGSGLGLTTAYAIVKRHDGYLTAKSKLGEGSTFIFYLPAMDSHQQQSEQASVESEVPGTGRILVMDDDEVVRSVVQRLLARNGYQVMLALHGQEAIDLYRAQAQAGRPFDAVIMDLTVPGGMGGKQAIKKLLEFDPHAKVIVFSGYSNDPVLSDYAEHGFCAVITKPFSVHEFSQALARVFASGRNDNSFGVAGQDEAPPVSSDD